MAYQARALCEAYKGLGKFIIIPIWRGSDLSRIKIYGDATTKTFHDMKSGKTVSCATQEHLQKLVEDCDAVEPAIDYRILISNFMWGACPKCMGEGVKK